MGGSYSILRAIMSSSVMSVDRLISCNVQPQWYLWRKFSNFLCEKWNTRSAESTIVFIFIKARRVYRVISFPAEKDRAHTTWCGFGGLTEWYRVEFDDLCCTCIHSNHHLYWHIVDWFDEQFRKWKSAILSIFWFSGRLCLNSNGHNGCCWRQFWLAASFWCWPWWYLNVILVFCFLSSFWYSVPPSLFSVFALTETAPCDFLFIVDVTTLNWRTVFPDDKCINTIGPLNGQRGNYYDKCIITICYLYTFKYTLYCYSDVITIE